MSKHNLSLETKYNIIIDKESGVSNDQIIVKYNLNSSNHICNLWRKRVQIKEAFLSGSAGSKKSLKKASHLKVEIEVTKFARSSESRLPRFILAEKARECALKLGIKDFQASDGWVSNFVRRNNIETKGSHREATSLVAYGEATSSVTYEDNWIKNLPSILKGFDPSDIYNVAEFALYYDLLPSKSYVVDGNCLRSIKKSNNRITVLLGSNSTGTDKLSPVIIGKSKKPRCFRGKIPVNYRSDQNAYMTTEIFTDYLKNWNTHLRMNKRNIVLFYDQSPSHPMSTEFSNITTVQLPTTSVLQPMDQGIINYCKSNFRRQVVKKMLRKIDTGTGITAKDVSINTMEAMHMLNNAWLDVKNEVINHCFSKAGIVRSTTTIQLGNQFEGDEILALFNDSSIEISSFDEYVNAEINVQTSADVDSLTDCVNPIDSVNDSRNDSVDDFANDPAPNPKPSLSKVLESLEVLSSFLMQEGEEDQQLVKQVDDIHTKIFIRKEKLRKQSLMLALRNCNK